MIPSLALAVSRSNANTDSQAKKHNSFSGVAGFLPRAMFTPLNVKPIQLGRSLLHWGALLPFIPARPVPTWRGLALRARMAGRLKGRNPTIFTPLNLSVSSV